MQCEMHNPTSELCLVLPAPLQIPLTQFKQNNQGNDPLGESHHRGTIPMSGLHLLLLLAV